MKIRGRYSWVCYRSFAIKPVLKLSTFQQLSGGFMSVKRVCLRVLLAVGVLPLMMIGGAMCQKQKSAEQETPKVGVGSSMPPSYSMMADSSTIMAGSMGKNMVSDSIANLPQTGYYTCPMHLQVHETKPGKCPVCGMSLVFKKSVTTAKTDKGAAIGLK
jgi:hypothetical protein